MIFYYERIRMTDFQIATNLGIASQEDKWIPLHITIIRFVRLQALVSP